MKNFCTKGDKYILQKKKKILNYKRIENTQNFRCIFNSSITICSLQLILFPIQTKHAWNVDSKRFLPNVIW